MAPTAYPKRDLPLRYGGRAFAISHPGRGDPHDAGGAVVLGRVRAERASQRNGALEGDIVHGITQPAGEPTQHGSFTPGLAMMPTRADGPRVDAQNLNDRFDGWEPDSGANGAPASFPTIPARLSATVSRLIQRVDKTPAALPNRPDTGVWPEQSATLELDASSAEAVRTVCATLAIRDPGAGQRDHS
jgi:hypothetical protein